MNLRYSDTVAIAKVKRSRGNLQGFSSSDAESEDISVRVHEGGGITVVARAIMSLRSKNNSILKKLKGLSADTDSGGESDGEDTRMTHTLSGDEGTNNIHDTKSSDRNSLNNERFSMSKSVDRKTAEKEERKREEMAAFRIRFNLPDTEQMVKSFSCALTRSGLAMHGRMYITTNFICFYSSLFNDRAMEKIAVSDVTEIKKTYKNITFGMRVLTTDGIKHDFASFFHRDKAFTLLNHMVETLKGGNPIISPSDLHSDPNLVDAVEDEGIEDLLLADEQNPDAGGFLSTSQEEKKEMLTHTFPFTAPKFYKLYFADTAEAFNLMFHEQRGDTDTMTKAWEAHPQFGNIRSVTYRAPVKSPIGPPITRCEETQRYVLTKNKFTLETLGVYYDIPFGDTFRVEGKWDVTNNPDGRTCNLKICVGLNFMKKTWFKGKIESGTLKETKEAFELWLTLARRHAASTSPALSLATTTDITPTPSVENVPNVVPAKRKLELPSPRLIVAMTFFGLLLMLAILGLWTSVSIVFLAITGCLIYLVVSLERQILALERRMSSVENKNREHSD
ncbi:GRAM domain-containing protein [Planoprotostelium fungivorum]|uniref:GRAM domain-containing protein n=1 Tax=Planoprotostelium fungivorum TaxID=1890364 RepID=A0A2P6N775_9EUKA|nr:GRAM domain-containing protein [Planoprotostelium fungivorum]